MSVDFTGMDSWFLISSPPAERSWQTPSSLRFHILNFKRWWHFLSLVAKMLKRNHTYKLAGTVSAQWLENGIEKKRIGYHQTQLALSLHPLHIYLPRCWSVLCFVLIPNCELDPLGSPCLSWLRTPIFQAAHHNPEDASRILDNNLIMISECYFLLVYPVLTQI